MARDRRAEPKPAARGLAALIPTADGDAAPAARRRRPIIGRTEVEGPGIAGAPGMAELELVQVAPDAIAPNPRQPRQDFDPEALAELAHSLREVGLLQPVVVKRVRASGKDRQYQLIAGERRLRAAVMAEMPTIPAIVRLSPDNELLREALLENLQRVQLNALEEAAAYGQLLADFGGTHEELARKLGRSRSQVSNTLRLLRLPPEVQRRVAAGVLSAGHARALVSLDNAEAAKQLAGRIVAEGLSVRAVEEIIAVGGGERRTQSRAAPKPMPEFIELARRLGERLETRVQVQAGSRRGRISIEFAGVEDLHRIAQLLGDAAGDAPG